MPKKGKKKTKFIGWKEDSHGDKEDTRPVELRKKPDISITWERLKKVLNLDD